MSENQMNDMKVLHLETLAQEEDLDTKIRAFWFPPYDGAYVEINGKKYTLVNEEILKTLQDKDSTALF